MPTTHYGHAMRILELSDNAREMAEAFRSFMSERGNQPVAICYRGMSGVATATALMLAILRTESEDHAVLPLITMVYVRKEGEKSHGFEVEFSKQDRKLPLSCLEGMALIFVDDFIDSGDTRNATFAAIARSQREGVDDLERYIDTAEFYTLVSPGYCSECRVYGDGPDSQDGVDMRERIKKLATG